MKTDRSEEEWDLIEQEANRAKIQELNEALEDSELSTYDDLKQEVEQLREAIADACFALDHSDSLRAKGYLLYALGEQDNRPALEENEQLREALAEIAAGLPREADQLGSDFEDHYHALRSRAETALDGGGDDQ